jgi:ParB family transcriptional regulator, chromosome partitioning protein
VQKSVKRLGRGLSSLISVPEEAPTPAPAPPQKPAAVPPAAAAPQPLATGIPVQQIRPNPFQPRIQMPPEQLQSLAESIRKNGVIQPILVRRVAEKVFELIAGERRWRAAQMAGLAEIPAVIRPATNEEMLEIALVENIFREDLNAIDRALAYKRYSDEFKLSAEEVANRLAEDRTTVTNYLRLLELPSEVKDWVSTGQLSMGHARCLLAIRSPSDLVNVAKQAIEEGLSVRALEKLVRDRVAARAAATQPAVPAGDAKRPQVRTLEQAFMRAVGTKVEINESRRHGRGKIVIHYHSLDDFDRITARLGVEPQH